MRNQNVVGFYVLVLAFLMAFYLTGCTKYNSQKKPWPVGTTPLYFNDINLDYAPPLKVDAYYFDSEDDYDGGYHYFYTVSDRNGKQFTHVIDYQLKR